MGVSAPSQETLWGLVGLKACAFSATMPAGEYAIAYSAEDSMGAVATVVRKLVVLQPCPDGEVRQGARQTRRQRQPGSGFAVRVAGGMAAVGNRCNDAMRHLPAAKGSHAQSHRAPVKHAA